MGEPITTEGFKASGTGHISPDSRRGARFFARRDQRGGRSVAAPIEGDTLGGERRAASGGRDSGVKPPGIRVSVTTMDAGDDRPEDHIFHQYDEATSANTNYKKKRTKYGILAGISAAITAGLGWLAATVSAAATGVGLGFETTLIVGAVAAALWPFFWLGLAITVVLLGVTYRMHKKARSSEVVLGHY